MEPDENPPSRFGLLAYGSCERWDVSIDESLEREDDWLIEIEGPTVYLVFRSRDLDVVAESAQFLKQRLAAETSGESMRLGSFGPSSVSLIWDDEGPRCVLLIGMETESTLRWTLSEEDAGFLCRALEHAAAELAQK